MPVRDTLWAYTWLSVPSKPCHTTTASPSSSSATFGECGACPDGDRVTIEPQAPVRLRGMICTRRGCGYSWDTRTQTSNASPSRSKATPRLGRVVALLGDRDAFAELSIRRQTRWRGGSSWSAAGPSWSAPCWSWSARWSTSTPRWSWSTPWWSSSRSHHHRAAPRSTPRTRASTIPPRRHPRAPPPSVRHPAHALPQPRSGPPRTGATLAPHRFRRRRTAESRRTVGPGETHDPGRRGTIRDLDLVEVMGFEPTASSMRPKRSSQLSYTPVRDGSS